MAEPLLESPGTLPYAAHRETLRDLFGARQVEVEPGRVVVDGKSYPVLDGVIILLDPSDWPPYVRDRLGTGPEERTGPLAKDIQFTFGAEWTRFPRILPEHEAEFAQYFDLLPPEELRGQRVADLGCGIGRWSYFLRREARELILVDFSEAIFAARRNLVDPPHALFFLGDLQRLPFRADFADTIVCLGVLHHLPTPALEEVKRLKRYAPRLLVYIYYAVDNRPEHYRVLLRGITTLRRFLARQRSPTVRDAVTWILAVGLYCPLIALGTLFSPLGMGRHVPLYEGYRGKGLDRIRQDVYDRFFTRIEQRVTRAEILALRSDFQRVEVSDRLPYWHFVCEA